MRRPPKSRIPRNGKPAAKPAPKRPAGEAQAWLLRCAPGLARLLVKEMQFRRILPRGEKVLTLRQRNHDLLFLPKIAKPGGLSLLRIAEEIHRCPVYGRYKISNHQLDLLAELLRRSGARRLVVTADGAHFNRHDLGRWLSRELAARGAGLSTGESGPALWLFCIDTAFYFAITDRTADDAPERKLRRKERPGSLPPPIAAALAFAATPADGDVICDPVCGSGTLLAEAHAYAPAAQIIGVDTDAAAVDIARHNLRHVDGADIRKGDARRLHVEPGRVTLFLANLPFGKQFGTTDSNPTLYRKILADALRTGAPGRWQGIYLTSDVEAFRSASREVPGLNIESLFQVKVRGEPATAYRVTPTGG
ncbi:MAG TPA: methyltransferase domain-containing protein [Dongiaceae bacterium]|jgi:predicted RNA methylase